MTGRVAIITGSAGGMGRASALLFAKSGANVVVADLNAAGGEETARLACTAGNRAVFQRTDVTVEADVAALVQRALDEFGRLDIMFSNAGIDGYPNLHAYSAAKAGVVNLTRSAALEFGRDRIRVNCIAPGGISTPIVYGLAENKTAVESLLAQGQPILRAGQPEDIANAALFLASDTATFITGHTLVVDGGATGGPIHLAPKPGENREPPTLRFAGPSLQRPG